MLLEDIFPEIWKSTENAAQSFQKALFALFTGEGEQPSEKLTRLLAEEHVQQQEALAPFFDWKVQHERNLLSSKVNGALSPLFARVEGIAEGQLLARLKEAVSDSLYDMRSAQALLLDVDEKVKFACVLQTLETRLKGAETILEAKAWLSSGNTHSELACICQDLKEAIGEFRETLIAPSGGI